MFSEQTERRCFAFVRTVANDCASCLRRNSENCGNCRSRWANSILKDMESDRDGNSKCVDYSLAARITSILLQVKTARCPISAREIKTDGICSRQLKHWTLRRLVAKRILVRTLDESFEGGRKFLYAISKEKKR